MQSKFIIILMVVLAGIHAFGQDTMEVRPVQITFLPPLGSNGLESGNYSNRLSFNVLAGYNGGVDGAELGGIVNITRQYVHGVQIAGFVNVNGGRLQGLQLAGFGNVNNDSMHGGQIAGFFNTNIGTIAGTQVGGFINVATNGLQGAQIAGFHNFAAGQVTGTQISGFLNVVAGDIKGGQLSFMNIARKVKGTQIGFLNIADSVSGASIGFLSLIRQGYNVVEVNVTESTFLTGAVKLGTERFYNIFTAGIQPGTDLRWGIGYGVGFFKPVSSHVGINMDLTAYHINEKRYFTTTLNEIYSLKLNFNYSLGKHLTFTGGPVLYAMYSSYKHTDKEEPGSKLPAYTFYSHTHNSRINESYWMGLNAGIRF